MILPEDFINYLEGVSIGPLVACTDNEVRVITQDMVTCYGYFCDITILASREQVFMNVTKLASRQYSIIVLEHIPFGFNITPSLKQDMLGILRSVFGLQPVLNDEYEFVDRDRHFMLDTCKNNPQICVVFDADNDYRCILNTALESDDELAPGKEVPDYIIRQIH